MPMEQRLEQAQKLILTQTVQQSLHCLQMSSQELSGYLQEEALSNPLLEVEDMPLGVPYPADRDQGQENLPIEVRERIAWEGGKNREDDGDFTRLYSRGQSFQEYLEEQLGQMKGLSGDQLALCRYLVGCLNSAGYLDCSLSELAEELGRPLFDLEQALFAVQLLDPPGVGARSLSECLLLQLAQGPAFNEVMIRLVQSGLPLLADQNYTALAELLEVKPSEAKRAAEVIRELNPIPSRGFDTGTQSAYIVPEASIRCEDGRVVVEMNEHAIPHVALNEEYCAMMNRRDCPDAQPYLKEKLTEAKGLMGMVRDRAETISRLLTAVVQYQRDYFLEGAALRPMTMSQMAEELDLSTSTVSRAVRDKYIQFQGKPLALRSLFTTALRTAQGENVSVETARQQLRRFVEAEDPAHPLSDEALRTALSGVGIEISRRTVAKYRGELNIPAASARKKRA